MFLSELADMIAKYNYTVDERFFSITKDKLRLRFGGKQ